MKPVLWSIGNYFVSSYVFFVGLGVFLGILIVAVMARRDGRAWLEIVDVLAVMILSALVGAKLFHVLLEARGHLLSDGNEAAGIWQLLQDDPWHWARFNDPGYVFYGGLLVSILTTWMFVKRKQIVHPLAYADYTALALAPGIFLGRLGCFLGGCCFGAFAERIPWAITYPQGPLAELGKIHPTQLYDALYGLWALWWLMRRYSKRRFFGEVFLWFLLSYGLWRFVTEYYRGDGDRGIWFSYFSTAQLISLLLVLVSISIFRWARVRSSLDN